MFFFVDFHKIDWESAAYGVKRAQQPWDADRQAQNSAAEIESNSIISITDLFFISLILSC